jgi:hypothetical protein
VAAAMLISANFLCFVVSAYLLVTLIVDGEQPEQTVERELRRCLVRSTGANLTS